MSTYDALADLPLTVDSYSLDGLEHRFSREFTRATTLVTLHGGGTDGTGEDVTYEPADHVALQAAGSVHPLAGEHTLGSFSELLDGLSLFEAEPSQAAFLDYRRWAFESAALDLALRQAGRSLGEAIGREARPLRYVVSMRLATLGSGELESADRVHDILARYPGTQFKLDATTTWSDDLIAELAQTGAVESIDLKGQYKNTVVDVETSADLYRKVAEAFPDAWLEDPDLDDPDAAAVLEPHRDRITWDAPIHSVADIEALPFPPRTVNIKPSRFGLLRRLCEAYDHCEANGIGAYGGGQGELGIGRDQIQYLAAVFHPEMPNDTAPREFNIPAVPDGLPASPIDLPLSHSGLRFA